MVKSADTIRAWNRGDIEIGVCHPKSLGHGTAMQDGGNVICHVDQWWDLELHDQVNERLGAMRQMQSGYDRDVFQHYIVAEGHAGRRRAGPARDQGFNPGRPETGDGEEGEDERHRTQQRHTARMTC
jgi:hypothetical protein